MKSWEHLYFNQRCSLYRQVTWIVQPFLHLQSLLFNGSPPPPFSPPPPPPYIPFPDHWKVKGISNRPGFPTLCTLPADFYIYWTLVSSYGFRRWICHAPSYIVEYGSFLFSFAWLVKSWGCWGSGTPQLPSMQSQWTLCMAKWMAVCWWSGYIEQNYNSIEDILF